METEKPRVSFHMNASQLIQHDGWARVCSHINISPLSQQRSPMRVSTWTLTTHPTWRMSPGWVSIWTCHHSANREAQGDCFHLNVSPFSQQRSPGWLFPPEHLTLQPTEKPRVTVSTCISHHSANREAQGDCFHLNISPLSTKEAQGDCFHLYFSPFSQQRSTGWLFPPAHLTLQPTEKPKVTVSTWTFHHSATRESQGDCFHLNISPFSHQRIPGWLFPPEHITIQPPKKPRVTVSTWTSQHSATKEAQGDCFHLNISPFSHQRSPGWLFPPEHLSIQPPEKPRVTVSTWTSQHSATREAQGDCFHLNISAFSHHGGREDKVLVVTVKHPNIKEFIQCPLQTQTMLCVKAT